MVGESLGPYEILEPLGAGGMGEVYRARDTKLEREVAIKLLSEELAGDAALLARFEREARLLAALDHPGIAAIHGLEEARGVRFLVLELVAGEGGEEPRWSPNGDEIFFRSGDRFWSVNVELGREPIIGTPEAMFDGPYRNPQGHSYELAPDGRFLLLEALQPPQPARINVVVGFFEWLKGADPESS